MSGIGPAELPGVWLSKALGQAGVRTAVRRRALEHGAGTNPGCSTQLVAARGLWAVREVRVPVGRTEAER